MQARDRAPVLYQPLGFSQPKVVNAMRAEHQALVDSIKQSVGLLRRHL
jgi:hypothetical protein